MKKILTSLFFIFLSVNSFSQNYETQTLINNEKIQLNSGGRIGGTTRSYMPIQVPAGCKAIVYTVTAYQPNKAIESNLNLAASLTFLSTGNVALSSVVGQIEIPTGTEVVNVYYLPGFNDVKNFLAKNDNFWRYIPDWSREQRTQTAVMVATNPFQAKTIYLGFKNPSMLNKIEITLNAVALKY